MAPGRRPTVNRNPPVNRSTNQNNVDINSGIDTQMLNQLIATRVAEALAEAACLVNSCWQALRREQPRIQLFQTRHATTRIRAVMHENFRGTEGVVGLTRWFEKLESQFGINNIAEGENSGKQDQTEVEWNLYNHNPQQHQPTYNLNPNKRPETARVFTAGQGSYAGKLPYCGKCGRHHTDACPHACYNCGKAGHKAKDCRICHPRPRKPKMNQEAKEDMEVDVYFFRCGEKDITKQVPNNMESCVDTELTSTKDVQVFLISYDNEEKTEISERRIEDVPVVRDFPEVQDDMVRMQQVQLRAHLQFAPSSENLVSLHSSFEFKTLTSLVDVTPVPELRDDFVISIRF
ncbi:reverse transcriptase domain-containing protein [Tanacetum coccineum]|uniref:Reverse transcriptase domain-containing protein n=1 Tax=Tanacetum coccineum TaxID=301880 RepID=A0ABQ5AGL9_9ASTR